MAHLDWLDRAAKAVNSDPAFRKLGSTDMRIAFKAGAVARGITFEAFEVTKVQDVDENDLRDWDLVIDMPARNWTNYLRQRADGPRPVPGQPRHRPQHRQGPRPARPPQVRTLPPFPAGPCRQGREVGRATKGSKPLGGWHRQATLPRPPRCQSTNTAANPATQ